MWAGISASRKLPLQQLEAAVQAAPLPARLCAPAAAGSADAAPGAIGEQAQRLLDGLKYRDQVRDGQVVQVVGGPYMSRGMPRRQS